MSRDKRLFFTADTHFGDHRTINIQRRPFATVAEMDETIVTSWNAIVACHDEIWHLGDVARRGADIPALLARLNGTKNLVHGNNDDPETSKVFVWEGMLDYVEIIIDGTLLVLCDYPFRRWNGQARRCINLHGHSQSMMKPMLRQFDVGVDARDYRPISQGLAAVKPRTLPLGEMPL